MNSFSVITKCKHCFNLKYLIKWLQEKDDCPICRSSISVNDLFFINKPSYQDFVNKISKENIVVICDDIWYKKLKQFDDCNLVIDELDFVNSKKITNTILLNLSNLTYNDINTLTNSNFNFVIT